MPFEQILKPIMPAQKTPQKKGQLIQYPQKQEKYGCHICGRTYINPEVATCKHCNAKLIKYMQPKCQHTWITERHPVAEWGAQVYYEDVQKCKYCGTYFR